jgi:DNA-binding transcriptional LysR family regulator
MFFARAPSTLLARSSALRSKFSSAGAEEAAASGGLLAGAVATTFGTYCLADFLSNFIQHPTQKVSFARGGGLSIPSTIVWMYSIRTS